MLPELVAQITKTVEGIDIDRLTVVDAGHNGSGSAVAGIAAQMPAAVISITEQIEAATGINILDALTNGNGAAEVEVLDAELVDVT